MGKFKWTRFNRILIRAHSETPGWYDRMPGLKIVYP
jgi:hypothetical protein